MGVPSEQQRNVVAHLELAGDCLNDEVVTSSPMVRVLTRRGLDPFFVWMHLEPVVAHPRPGVEIRWLMPTLPEVPAPVSIPADPTAPGALPHLLQILAPLRSVHEVGEQGIVHGLASVCMLLGLLRQRHLRCLLRSTSLLCRLCTYLGILVLGIGVFFCFDVTHLLSINLIN